MKILPVVGLTVALVPGVLGAAEAQQSQPDSGLSAIAINQISALLQEKAARTPAQRKIDSALLYALKRQRQDPLLDQVPMLRSGVKTASDGTILVDIKATVTDELLDQIKSSAGTIINSFSQYNAIRAKIPLNQIEVLAASPDVQSIRRADEFMLNKINTSQGD